ncbi:hypothetical protein ACFIOY_36700 [Bradyrhizobium sp. TZ2]
MIATDTLLVNCPCCAAWPMAAALPKPNSAHGDIRFTASGAAIESPVICDVRGFADPEPVYQAASYRELR